MALAVDNAGAGNAPGSRGPSVTPFNALRLASPPPLPLAVFDRLGSAEGRKFLGWHEEPGPELWVGWGWSVRARALATIQVARATRPRTGGRLRRYWLAVLLASCGTACQPFHRRYPFQCQY